MIHRVPVPLLMLLHQRKRLALSLAAIGFAVLVMFMELGFFNGLNDAQAILPSRLDADLVMLHEKRVHLNKWNTFTLNRIYQARSFPGVRECFPIYQGQVNIRHTESDLLKTVMCVAFSPDAHPFSRPNMRNWDDALKRSDAVIFDRLSRDIYGPVEPGMWVNIAGTDFKVAGTVDFGPNMSYDGQVFMSDSAWMTIVDDPNLIQLAIIRTEPGTDLNALREDLSKLLPDDIVLMTPDEVRFREIIYTVRTVPIGAVFGVGLIVGMIIGVIICYQILFNEITDHLAQYATLKAMGFSNRYLMSVVLLEAVFLSVLGFVPGVLATAGFYAVVGHAARIFMVLTIGRMLLIFCLTVLMCTAAGMIAARKVLKADPAELF